MCNIQHDKFYLKNKISNLIYCYCSNSEKNYQFVKNNDVRHQLSVEI